jgi:hypothetical protein
MISPQELQDSLRVFGGPLGDVLVTPSPLAPWIVKIEGRVLLHGEVKFFEASTSLREINSEQDILRLASMFLEAFGSA